MGGQIGEIALVLLLPNFYPTAHNSGWLEITLRISQVGSCSHGGPNGIQQHPPTRDSADYGSEGWRLPQGDKFE